MMDLRFRYAVSFVTMMCLVFGLCFELPVVVLTLCKLDLLNSSMMRNTRSYAIVAMFIVAAIVTPTPDIFTMSLLAGPMIVLYEICIWLAWWMERKAAKVEAAEKERQHQALVESQRRAKQRAEAEDAEAKSEDEIREAPPGTLAYDPGNAAVYDEDADHAEDGDETKKDEEPDYDSGLGDIEGTGDSGSHDEGDDSDAVWDRPGNTTGSESDQAEDPYGHDHWDHDYHGDHSGDHYHHDDYYSGPTEELKRSLREELKADLKSELKDIIKTELREELLEELREEIRHGRETGEDDGEGS